MKEGGLRVKGILKSPKISIITVVFNGEMFIEHTISSVIRQTFIDFEYIIIDGGSTDNTLDIIKKYEKHVDYWVSESDKGIYDAMNKGISIAHGEWLNFMNAGDRFVNDNTLAKIFSVQNISNETTFLFSDWYFCDFNIPSKLYFNGASWEQGNILHQSTIYKKSLHQIYGNYIITKKIIISDYIFFNLIDQHQVLKVNIPISINDRNGISTGNWCFEQKVVVDFLFGKIHLKQMLRIFMKIVLLRFLLKCRRVLKFR